MMRLDQGGVPICFMTSAIRVCRTLGHAALAWGAVGPVARRLITIVAVASELEVVTDGHPPSATVAPPPRFDSGHGLGHCPAMRDVDVLIVGGGPVGLTASILLSKAGVTSLLVERHPGTALHPKARGINARTMEIYRQCGVEDAIRAAGLPPERSRFIVWTRSLAGEELERRVPGARGPKPWRSPRSHAACAPRTTWSRCCAPTRNRSARARSSSAPSSPTFAQDADGVTASVRTADGDTRLRARYLIAADGRAAASARRSGSRCTATPASTAASTSAQRRSHALGGRSAGRALLRRAAGSEGDLPHDQRRQSLGIPHQQPAARRSSDEYTPERCAAIVRQAAGVPDLDVEILGAVPGWPAGQVAERYRRDRVFLAGDAAHHMPPTEASASTRACRTSTTSSGSWPRSFRAGPGPACSIPTRTSGCPTGARSPSRRWSTPARSAGASRSPRRRPRRWPGRSSSTSSE